MFPGSADRSHSRHDWKASPSIPPISRREVINYDANSSRTWSFFFPVNAHQAAALCTEEGGARGCESRRREEDETREETAKLLAPPHCPSSVDLLVRYCASVSRVYCPVRRRHYSTDSSVVCLQFNAEHPKRGIKTGEIISVIAHATLTGQRG